MAKGDELASFPPDEESLMSLESQNVLAEQKAARDMLSYLKDQEDMGNFVGAGQLISDEFTRADLDAAKAMQAKKMGISVEELERQQALVNRFEGQPLAQYYLGPGITQQEKDMRLVSKLRANPDIMTGFSEDFLPGGMSTENPLELQRMRDKIRLEDEALLAEQERQIQEQEAQDQLKLAEIRAMFGGDRQPRRFGARNFSGQREQILEDYKKSFQEAQAFETERKQKAQEAVDSARERFEEASDLQGKFKFDPNRILKSTGDTIAAAIFVGLSAAANAMAGQPGAKNQALEIINGAINRDIESQKLEYQKLKDQTSASDNLYARNMQLLQNERLSENLTKQQMLQMAEGQARISLKNVSANEAMSRFNAQIGASIEKARLETAQAFLKYQSDAAKGVDLTVPQQTNFRQARQRAQNAVETFKVAETQLASLAGNIKNFDQADKTAIEGITNAMYRIIANRGDTSEQGRSSMGKALDAIVSQIDDRFASARQLANIMKQMAFAMASERQSASSISNRDVQMFAQLLNDESAPIQQVGMFFEHMRAKAEINRDAIRLIETGQASIADADFIAASNYAQRNADGPVIGIDPESGAPITRYLVNYGDLAPAPSAGLQSLEIQ